MGDSTDRGAKPRRPRPRRSGLFALYGGKYKLAPWIVENLPYHSGYVEPFSGGAHVLFAKPRCRMEVLNDIDGGIVAAMRAARDYPDELATLLRMTPYARDEHALACEVAKAGFPGCDGTPREVLSAARWFMVLSQQQMFAQSRVGTWRTPPSHRIAGGPQLTWSSLPDVVHQASERLQGVAIEHRPAVEVIRAMDHPEVLFYLDPPYHPKAADCKGYRCVMTQSDHQALAELLVGLQGMVVLSGYQHEDYARWFDGWQTLTHEAVACTAAGAGSKNWNRTEGLWFNPRAWERRLAGLAEATA